MSMKQEVKELTQLGKSVGERVSLGKCMYSIFVNVWVCVCVWGATTFDHSFHAMTTMTTGKKYGMRERNQAEKKEGKK